MKRIEWSAMDDTTRAQLLTRPTRSLAAGVKARVEEVMADVAECQRAEDGIGDGVAQRIGIRVAEQAVAVRDGHAAEDERTVFRELVNVVADAGHEG